MEKNDINVIMTGKDTISSSAGKVRNLISHDEFIDWF